MKQLVIRNYETNEIIAAEKTRKKNTRNCVDDVKRLLGIRDYLPQGKIYTLSPYRADIHYIALGNNNIPAFNYAIEEA